MGKLRLLLIFVVLLTGRISAAEAQSCSDIDLDAAVERGRELTTLLKIANFRADVAYMGEVATEQERFLETCGNQDGGRLALVCDFDCHLQLARYRLFLASDLPFLSSASTITRSDSPLSPQGAQDIARVGLEIIERGLKFLARQQGSNEGEESSYRGFVHQLVALSALKIQLLISTGDTWYQTVSEARIKQLDFKLAESLDTVGGAGIESQPNLSKAYTQYETARWTLVETSMDIPGESTYDDLRAELLVLENDLEERIQSLNKGFLFLNIDPFEFTTISFEELEQRIERVKRNIESIESKVESLVERWHANKQGEATRMLDEKRTIRSQEVNLVAHRIGKIEQQAQIFTNELQQEINAVTAERDTFGFRQQIRGLEIELANKMAEFDNRVTQLNQRRELDLIVLSKEVEIERRNELRWLLNYTMTEMNLDLQISSIETQINEYGRQVLRNTSQQEQINTERAILRTQIASAEDAIEQAEASIEEIHIRQNEIFAKRRAVMREEICGIESQLAFIGDTADTPFLPLLGSEQVCDVPDPAFTRNEFNTQMCGVGAEPGLRKELFDQQIQARAFVMKCVVGDVDFSDLEEMVPNSSLMDANIPLPDELASVSCDAFSATETQFAKDIYNKEKDLLLKQEGNFQEAIEQIENHILSIILWASVFDGTIIAVQTGLALAEAAKTTAAAIPETTVAVAGLASGTYVTVDFYRPAEAAVDALTTLLNAAIQIGKVTQSTMTQVQALERQLTQLQNANELIDYQKALKSVALHRTHFQLAGRRAQGVDEIEELMLRNTMADVDCDNQQLGVEEQVARLKVEHTRQLASMNLHARENDLLSFQLATQQRQIQRHHNEIGIHILSLAKLDISDAQLAEDSTRIDSLITAARSRIERVNTTRAIVEGLSQESLQVTNVINELRERQSNQLLAINDGELAFIEQRISQETGNTEVLTSKLNDAIALGLKNSELQGNVLLFQNTVLKDVQEKQEQLTELVSQIDNPEDRRNLFIANQETLAELMKGIPEYIVAKRRALETANQLLHLMRRRFAIVHGITGQSESWPSTYVKNATQLTALVDDISFKRFFDERQIKISVARIVIPADSAFTRKLALTDSVDFEVSPFAATEVEMEENGYFSLWATNKFSDQKNMNLIDVFIGTNYLCTSDQWNNFELEHAGSGYVFQPLTEGSNEVTATLLTGPPRSRFQVFQNSANSQAEIDRIIRYWVQDHFQVREFPRPNGPPNDTSANLPYLGAPLISSYKLSVNASDCPFDGAIFTMYFIFASAL